MIDEIKGDIKNWESVGFRPTHIACTSDLEPRIREAFPDMLIIVVTNVEAPSWSVLTGEPWRTQDGRNGFLAPDELSEGEDSAVRRVIPQPRGGVTPYEVLQAIRGVLLRSSE